MEKRDTKFFSELKQLNEDLIGYLKETQEKSPYFDFSPTLEDYVKQFKDLNQKYPEKFTFSAIQTTTTTSTTPLFSFSSATTNSTNIFGTGASTGSFNLWKPPAQPSGNLDVGANNGTDKVANTEADANADTGDDDAPPPLPNVEKYDEPDAKYSVRCKLYELGGKGADGKVQMNLLGIGQLFIKAMDDPHKLQVIFRQDPDLRRVLLNEVLTPSLPVKSLPKAVQLVFPVASGGTKFYIAKLKEDTDAKILLEKLKFN